MSKKQPGVQGFLFDSGRQDLLVVDPNAQTITFLASITGASGTQNRTANEISERI
jgi:hypothetical protein